MPSKSLRALAIASARRGPWFLRWDTGMARRGSRPGRHDGSGGQPVAGAVRRPSVIAGLALTLLLLALGVGRAIAEAPQFLDYDAVFRIESASDPQISPDGETIAYVRRFSDEQTDRSYTNLWIVRFDGSENRPLTSGYFLDREPRWSPDGRQLAFVSNREGSNQVYRLLPASGRMDRLTDISTSPSDLAWSPDGSSIAFVALVPEPELSLATMPKPPPGATWAAPARLTDRLIYRFNGIGYLPNGFLQIFLLPAAGGNPRQLTRGSMHHTLFHHAAGELRRTPPVWTPDGKHLLISANPAADSEYQERACDILEISAETGEVTPLTSRDGPDYEPAISPDGRTIAYVGYDDRHQPFQASRLHLMNRDGGASRVLLPDFDYSVSGPKWSPDGKGITFIYAREGMLRLARLDVASQRVVTITQEVGAAPSFNLSGYISKGSDYSVSDTGRFVIPHAQAERAGDLAAGTIQVAGARVITDVNSDLLGGKTLANMEEISFSSSADGRKIQGWILKPPGFTPRKKYPLILVIHGGPHLAYGPRFDLQMQIMAAKGYLILFPNYRGSTSYGEEFANLVHDTFPGDAYFDLISGVDELTKRGFVDTSALFVTGPSAGGQLTLWVIGKDPRFAAAAAVMPVVNRISSILTSDRSGIYTQYRYKGLPWQRAQHYLSLSPLSLVDRVTTPVLLVTAEEDYRTPPGEAEQYYRALKLLRRHAVLMRVPGEPHAVFFRRPSHQYATLLNTIAWFERHRPGSHVNPAAAPRKISQPHVESRMLH